MTNQKISKTPETDTKPDTLQPTGTELAKDKVADTDLDKVSGGGFLTGFEWMGQYTRNGIKQEGGQ